MTYPSLQDIGLKSIETTVISRIVAKIKKIGVYWFKLKIAYLVVLPNEAIILKG